jgi:hypothetical protein
MDSDFSDLFDLFDFQHMLPAFPPYGQSTVTPFAGS